MFRLNSAARRTGISKGKSVSLLVWRSEPPFSRKCTGAAPPHITAPPHATAADVRRPLCSPLREGLGVCKLTRSVRSRPFYKKHNQFQRETKTKYQQNAQTHPDPSPRGELLIATLKKDYIVPVR